jgi:16S rRNA (guanine966-N2)-methyltransferase
MRVIAGKAKGRRLKAPTTGTRPMTDRIREALFSSLGDIEGARVLDLYAGSGSLGLEALSRGAAEAIFVENARDAILKLRQNIEETGFTDAARVEWDDVASVLSRTVDARVDLIFVDPPYSTPAAITRATLETIVTNGYLSDTGRIVLHRPAKDTPPSPLGLETSWDREFGQSRIYVFVHEQEPD